MASQILTDMEAYNLESGTRQYEMPDGTLIRTRVSRAGTGGSPMIYVEAVVPVGGAVAQSVSEPVSEPTPPIEGEAWPVGFFFTYETGDDHAARVIAMAQQTWVLASPPPECELPVPCESAMHKYWLDDTGVLIAEPITGLLYGNKGAKLPYPKPPYIGECPVRQGEAVAFLLEDTYCVISSINGEWSTPTNNAGSRVVWDASGKNGLVPYSFSVRGEEYVAVTFDGRSVAAFYERVDRSETEVPRRSEEATRAEYFPDWESYDSTYRRTNTTTGGVQCITFLNAPGCDGPSPPVSSHFSYDELWETGHWEKQSEGSDYCMATNIRAEGEEKVLSFRSGRDYDHTIETYYPIGFDGDSVVYRDYVDNTHQLYVNFASDVRQHIGTEQGSLTGAARMYCLIFNTSGVSQTGYEVIHDVYDRLEYVEDKEVVDKIGSVYDGSFTDAYHLLQTNYEEGSAGSWDRTRSVSRKRELLYYDCRIGVFHCRVYDSVSCTRSGSGTRDFDYYELLKCDVADSGAEVDFDSGAPHLGDEIILPDNNLITSPPDVLLNIDVAVGTLDGALFVRWGASHEGHEGAVTYHERTGIVDWSNNEAVMGGSGFYPLAARFSGE